LQVNPDLRQLRQLVAILDHGSLNRAAIALDITQPTLSRSIARLEDQLGVSLFDRSGVAVRPTEFGRHLAERARSLINEANELGHWLQMLSKGATGSIRIGFGPVPRAIFLARSLAAIVERFPDLTVDVAIGSATPLFHQLLAREIDLAVVSGDDIERHAKIELVDLLSAPFVAVAGPEHPLAGRKGLNWRDLLPYPLVEPSVAENVVATVDPDVAAELVASVVICADFATIREMVHAGPFVSIAPRPVFSGELASGRLVALDLDISATYTCVAALN
jgi:DNA-binding transcriptional LysR family regulator